MFSNSLSISRIELIKGTFISKKVDFFTYYIKAVIKLIILISLLFSKALRIIFLISKSFNKIGLLQIRVIKPTH